MLEGDNVVDKKTVLVTGGASGIGRAIATKFAGLGANVAIVDVDEAKGNTTLRSIKEISDRVRFLPADVGDTDVLPSVVDRVVEAFGSLDVLINNAATKGSVAPLLDFPLPEFVSVLGVNLIGPFRLAQLAAKQMVQQETKGTIINVLTIQTRSPLPGHSAYVASKGGLEALTLSMAVDLADQGIRVNGIQVGYVLSDSFRELLGEEHYEVPTLLGRMGTPEEIAEVAAFLASEKASFLTGSVVRADGGRMISRKKEPLL